MILLFVEAMGGTVEFARSARAAGIGAEVMQQGPAAQTAFAGTLTTVQAPMRVQHPVQSVGEPINHVAGPSAPRMVVRPGVF